MNSSIIKRTCSMAAIFIVFSIGQSQSYANEEALSKTRQAQLTHIVKQDCGSCHGMTLKGGLGPALLMENLQDKPILFIQNAILHGRPGTAMPPWKTLLTEQEALWIAEQLKEGNIAKNKPNDKHINKE
ncbi:MAG: cytochrome c [Colwellia sp.]|nr:cytochrome c [Colwellia sp.]MCW8863271.1 cytochrome c [Colwellia sp.]MCW9080434.1 cytochrome c [Colwellia sp.]